MATSLLPKGSVKPQRAGDSIRGKTVSMVENHLNKQRSAYDQWIAELCRDAEESAMERDRLKAKLAALREDHKRKVIMKIVGRLGNMQYYCAWSTWYNVTVKMHQQKIEKTIRELRSELESTKKKTEDVEAEAQRRADEAAKMSLGAASESQRKLILKIMTKLTQGLARLGWNQWAKQAFGHKMQQQKMKKIIKRLLRRVRRRAHDAVPRAPRGQPDVAAGPRGLPGPAPRRVLLPTDDGLELRPRTRGPRRAFARKSGLRAPSPPRSAPTTPPFDPPLKNRLK